MSSEFAGMFTSCLKRFVMQPIFKNIENELWPSLWMQAGAPAILSTKSTETPVDENLTVLGRVMDNSLIRLESHS